MTKIYIQWYLYRYLLLIYTIFKIINTKDLYFCMFVRINLKNTGPIEKLTRRFHGSARKTNIFFLCILCRIIEQVQKINWLL